MNSFALHGPAHTDSPHGAPALAAEWYARLADCALSRSARTLEIASLDLTGGVPLTAHTSAGTLAAFAEIVLDKGKTLLVLVPDDEYLPALSNALNLSLRPLCLVLPSADFAARIALRATLSLMKSRLSRDGDDDQGVAWQTQRQTLAGQQHLWNDAQDWNASNERSAWPEDVARLFPARILPMAAFRSMPVAAADIAVFFNCHPGTDAPALGAWQLHIGSNVAYEGQRAGAVALVDETQRLQIELAQLSQDVGELELELITAQAEMSQFTSRYYAQVGRRMTELDVLQAKLAKQRATELARAAKTDAGQAAAAAAADEAQKQERQAEQSREEARRFAEAETDGSNTGGPSTEPFRPSQHVKRLFRQLAQKIHPDRALDEHDRAWRTQLMSEANRAYKRGDTDALAEIAALWEEGRPHETPATTALSTSRSVLQQQITRLRKRFNEIKAELHRLFGSKLYELFLAARQALRHGRDLLQEMADKLDRQIADTLAALNAG